MNIYLVVIPWARVVCLIYTPEARGLRVYISGKPQASAHGITII